MRKGRMPTWLTLAIVGVGLLLLAIPGMWVVMSVTATRLHPSPKDVPTTVATPAHAPPESARAAIAKARQASLEHLSTKNLPGLSVAVGIEGDLVWAEGFGLADIRTSLPVRPDHRFRIGTASTVLTSAAAGMLLEQGRLKPDGEIQAYVPPFPRKEWPVTLRQVMGHTAGIVPDGGDEGPLLAARCGHPVEALKYFAGDDLLFQPDTAFRYSSPGWILVSAAVETGAGKPFLTFMREQILDPLGMRDTGPDPGGGEPTDESDFALMNLIRDLVGHRSAKSAVTPNTGQPQKPEAPGRDRVTPYFPRFAGDPEYGLQLMRPLEYSCYSGASVFVSTPSDLVRFGMAINRGKLLKPATIQLLQTSQRLASGEETGYGLGWYVKKVTLAGKQTRALGHNGDSLGGMVASLLTIPEQGIVVAVTSNMSYSGTSTLALKIAEAFANSSTEPRP